MTIREAKAALHVKEWSQMVQQCQESGLSVKEWCSLHNIKIACYYKRLARVRKTALEQCNLTKAAEQPTLVKVEPECLEQASPQCVEVGAVTAAPFFRLQYHNATLEIPVGAGSDDIAEVLKAVSQYAV